MALSIALAFTSTTGILHAEDSINAGKEKSEACVSCHGDNGNSIVSTFPKLAEQHSSYLIKQLQAFKIPYIPNVIVAAIKPINGERKLKLNLG